MNARTDWSVALEALAPTFAGRAAQRDENDDFAVDDFGDLKDAGFYAAGVPGSLGGAGLELAELCRMLRTLGRASPSTALAFSMHTHLVAVSAWRLKHQQAPVGPLLEKIARQGLLILSTGGGDWLESSGEAVPVEGGFRVTARKPFSSGAPAGDLLSTSAVVRGSGSPAEVIHFGVPMKAPGVSIVPTWRAMGMRNTASHDISLDNVFVPQEAVTGRRPQGKWHPLFHLISMIALPLIYSVYVGVAEAARERALAIVRRRRPDEHLLQAVGEMENQLEAARTVHSSWVSFCVEAKPGPETTARSMIHRTLTARAVLATVDAAMDAAGGAAFFRANGLEKLFRDAQGARYHPLQEGLEKTLAARSALGLEF